MSTNLRCNFSQYSEKEGQLLLLKVHTRYLDLLAGIVKTGIEDGGTVCSHYRTFERIQGDPRGVSDGPKRDMCSRVELIFKNYPDLYVPINPIFFPKLDGMN